MLLVFLMVKTDQFITHRKGDRVSFEIANIILYRE